MSDVQAVIEHYQNYHPRSRPGAKEQRLIRERLKDGYSVADLKEAIDGCHRSPFHCGENDRGNTYLSLSLIMRDSDHVVKFIELASQDLTVITEKTRRTIRAAKQVSACQTNHPLRISRN